MDNDEIKENLQYLEEVIADYEAMINNIGKNHLSASLLMNYRDEIQDLLSELTPLRINLTAYWKKIVILDNKLRGNAQKYVSEVGHNNFKQYQIINDPPKERWWWYLDKVTLPPPEPKKPWEFWKK